MRAWLLAARPKTLTGAAVPVMIGATYAWHECAGEGFGWLPMILCFLFAFIMQIDANFVNDYYDCVKGKDNEKRLGPKRACQQGWITLKAMRVALVLTTVLACLVGLPLIQYGGVEMIAVGALCVVFCFLYTTLFSDIALGDLLVVMFFGVVPLCCTWWVCSPLASWGEGVVTPLVLSVACGLVVDTLLIVNNYRDIDNDREVGKKTLVVLIGKKASEWLYVVLPALAIVMVLCLFGWTNMNIILTFAIYFLYTGTWNKMRVISHGKELNRVLGLTARNIFIYGILTSLLIILQ